jgi:hypothetical protein
MVYNSIDDVKKALETAVTNKDARLYLLEPGNIKISVENVKEGYRPILIRYPKVEFNVEELNDITDERKERAFALQKEALMEAKEKSHIIETAKKTVESQEKGETIVRDSSSSEVTDMGSGTILSTIVAASNKQEEQLEKEESIPPVMDDSMKDFLQKSKMYNDAKKTVAAQEKGETIIRDSKSSIVQNSNSNSNSTLSSIVSATSEYASSPDMLTGTGYTQVMKPINIEEVPETTIPKETVIETPKDIEPGITRAPQKVPKVKKFTPVNTPKKESGIADGIILAVIVLVYVAIIVNLVIRLK